MSTEPAPSILSVVEPVVDIVHGQQIPDPYRWLEDPNSRQTRAWIDEQTARTRGYMDALPNRSIVRERVTELLDVETWDTPLQCRGRVFFLRRQRQQLQPCICLLEDDRDPTCVVDPSDNDPTGATSVHIVAASGTGRYLAYGVKRGGEDAQVVHILDVQRKQRLAEQLPRGYWCALQWSETEEVFYYLYSAVIHLRS